MVEALNIHSIVFEITNRLGFGKDAGLIIAILIFLILMTLDHAYVLLGSKAFLVLSLGVGLFSTLLFYVSAEQVNLGNAPETIRLTCLMGRMFLFSTVMVVSCRVLKTKVLDPIAKKNMQREFEKILKEEGIDPESEEAQKLQAILDWDGRNIIKFLNDTEPDFYFDEESE